MKNEKKSTEKKKQRNLGDYCVYSFISIDFVSIAFLCWG